MFTRLYVDNWRSFVNFELPLDGVRLLLGNNGTGKTGIFDVLRVLKGLLLERRTVSEVLPRSSLTRFERRLQQRFELDLDGNAGRYRYTLVVDHDPRDPKRAHIHEETLFYDAALIGEFKLGIVTLHNDAGETATPYRADGSWSGLATVVPDEANTRLKWFKQRLAALHVLSIDPRRMESWSEATAAHPADDLANFAAWFRGLQQRKFRAVASMFDTIKEIIPGFEELGLDSDNHERGRLRLLCRSGPGMTADSYDFSELSDGQRALIGLYTIHAALMVPNTTVCLDEPDNFVALRELQPWLLSVLDEALVSNGAQVLLISHNTEVIDLLGHDRGLWFYREVGGPTRVRPFSEVLEGPLSPSAQVARGVEP